MRFICTELGGESIDLFSIGREDSETATDNGEILSQAMAITQNKQGIERKAYYFGGALEASSGRFALDGSARTITQIETALGVEVDTNFSDSATYRTNFHKLSEIATNLWYTLLTDDGVAFYVPARKSTSAQCQNYVVIARTDRSGIFKSVNYSGETGADIYVALNERGGILPSTVDDTQKARVVNKFYSLNGRLTIQTTEELFPLDYIIEDGSVYLVMSRKAVANALQYECVLEVTDSRSFAGDDVTATDSVNATLFDSHEIATVTSTMPTYGNYSDISYPSGFTLSNIIGVHVIVGGSTYRISLNYVSPVGAGFLRFLLWSSFIRIYNDWTTTTYDGTAVTATFIREV